MERRLKIESSLRKFTKDELLRHVRRLRMFTRGDEEREKGGEMIEDDEERMEIGEEEEEGENDEGEDEGRESKRIIVEKLSKRLRKDVSTEFAASHLSFLSFFLHRHKRVWRLFHFDDQRDDHESSLAPHDIEKQLLRSLKVSFPCTTTVQIHNGAYWIRITLPPTGRATANQQEKIIYAVYYNRFPYVGTTAMLKKHSSFVLNALAKLFGYKQVTRTALADCGIDGLFRLARDKGNVGIHLQTDLENPLSFTGSRLKQTTLKKKDERIKDLDEKRKEEREAYNEAHFGTAKRSPIRKLTYVLEAPFEGEQFAPSMADRRHKPFRCTLVLEGRDVCKGIEELVAAGIAKAPLPRHLAEVRTLGRTEFLIRKKRASEKPEKP